MCALTSMFPNKQQEWYSASTMEYLWLSQVDSCTPTLHFPSFLYPLHDSKSYNINLHPHHMSLSHSNGSNSNSNNDQEEEDRGTVLEKKLNHNASERDRRRKLNALYSSLRALLPPPRRAEKQSDDGLNRLFLPTDRSKLAHRHRDCCPDCYIEMDMYLRHVA